MISVRSSPHAGLAWSLAAAAVVAMAVPVPARAGTYTLTACSPQSSSGAWTQTDTDPGGLAAGNMCGGSQFGPFGTGIDQGALYGEDNLGEMTSLPTWRPVGRSRRQPARLSPA